MRKLFIASMLFSLYLCYSIAAMATPIWGTPESNAQTGSWGHLDGDYWHGYVTGLTIGSNIIFSRDGNGVIGDPGVGYAQTVYLNSSQVIFSSKGSTTSNMEFQFVLSATSEHEIGDASLLNYGNSNVLSGDNLHSIINHQFGYNFAHILGTQNYVEFRASYINGGSFDYEYLYPLVGASFIGYDCEFGESVGGGDTGTEPVPEPSTMILLSSGLLGLLGARKKGK